MGTKKKHGKGPSHKKQQKASIFRSIISSFVNSFSFSRNIAEIDALNASLEATTPRGETLNSLSLPVVVVIGDESSGKSSTLERIAMCPVLPRASGICTRQPIKLMLRFDKSFPADQPQITLTIPRQSPIQGTPEEIQSAINTRMQEIAADPTTQGLVMDSEILVEIRSEAHINMDLVDLPGLIVTRGNGVDDALAERTEQCTRSYLSQPNTGVVLCVIDATIHNLRVSRAIRLIQDASPKIQQHTIGVFAKADRAVDANWEDDDRSGKLWQLEERLFGQSEDVVQLQGGFAALVNRNPRNRKQVNMAFSDHEAYETEWFLDNTSSHFVCCSEEGKSFTDEGKTYLGLNALKEQISTAMQRHLNANWVPTQLASYRTKLADQKTKLASLGDDPKTLGLPALVAAANNALQAPFGPSMIDTICDTALASVLAFFPETIKCATYFEEVKLMRDLRASVLAAVEDPLPLRKLGEVLTNTISTTFGNDNTGPIQLFRFNALAKLYSDSLRSTIDAQKSTFVAKSKAAIERAFEHFRLVQVEGTVFKVLVARSIKSCLIEFIVLPALNVSGGLFQFVAAARLSAVPEESHAAERVRLHAKIAQLNTIVAKLEQLQRGSP